MKGNKQLIEQVAKISAEIAAKEAIEHLEKIRQEEQKIKRDRRLRNTRLLLRNYRSFKHHCEDIKMELDVIASNEILEEIETDEFAVESIKRSKKRTLAMVQFIDQMLTVYKIICEQSEKQEDLRRYLTVYDLYISDKRKTHKEVAECHNVHIRTVSRDVNEAVKTLSVLLFGVDGIRLMSR